MPYQDHPRADIVVMPTPLQPLDRMSKRLGIDLWVKRDDLAGPAFGGCKARQLEYHLGAAHLRGADTVLVSGAIQSNFMRMAASCARALGMETVAQLEERMDQADARYLSSGNVFLSQILGAELVSAPDADNEVTADASLRTMAEKLRGGGRVPYVIGTSPQYTPLGALGYVRAAEEILSQGYDFDLFVVASGSGNTHAGLLAGLRAFGSSAQVVGSCVSRPVAEQEIRLGQTLRGLEGFLGEAYSVTPEDVFLWDGALAPGYGKTGPAAIEAMRLAADEEGLLLDPVYTSKAFAMIPVLVADGTIPMGSRVCFIHTGGLASLFGYEPTLRPSLLKG